jgi:hypothetical protein
MDSNSRKYSEISKKSSSSSSSYANTIDPDSITHAASIAASIAAMNFVNHPFVKIHSELEEKIGQVLKQLETLKESKSINDNNNKKQKKTCVDDSSSSESDSGMGTTAGSKNYESDLRLKYLEKVQENQFQLLTQLISTIGTNNRCSDYENPPESLSKTQEPLISHNNNDKIRFKSVNKKPKRSNSSQKQQTQPRNGRSPVKNITNKSKSTRESRDRSRSRSGCSTCDEFRRSQSRDRNNSLNRLKNNRSSERKRISSNSKSRGEFLEELLDTVKSDVDEMDRKNNFSDYDLKKSIFNDLYPDQPTLFDKYLVS